MKHITKTMEATFQSALIAYQQRGGENHPLGISFREGYGSKLVPILKNVFFICIETLLIFSFPTVQVKF